MRVSLAATVGFCFLVGGMAAALAQSPSPAQSAAVVASPAPTQSATLMGSPAQSAAPAQSPVPAETPAAAVTQSCPGNPNALGTSRVLTIDPGEFSRIGSMQYKQTLPLNDHEVVITLDDGPIPPYSNSILDTLDSQCVKATYFMVGEMARNYPSIVRRIYNSGHTIGTHSQNHPRGFEHLGSQGVERQVDGGIASTINALGDPKALAPFFRIPGLGRSTIVESFLAEHRLVTWSADIDTNDWWRGTTPSQIVQRAMRRLNAKGRGILLMHDIHPATVMALPMLLKELKAGGYRVVHVVPAGERPQSVPDLPASAVASGGWPRVIKASASSVDNPVKTVHARTKLVCAKGTHTKHARIKIAHNDADPVVTASIAKKKSKAQTAQPDLRNYGCRASARVRLLRLSGLVRPRGLEPPRVAPLAPQASASTNSAMAAWGNGRKALKNLASQRARTM